MRLIPIIMLVHLMSCSSESGNESFRTAVPQEASERVFKTLEIDTTINLYDALESTQAWNLVLSDEFLIYHDLNTNKIEIFDAMSMNHMDSMKLREGRGPGEIVRASSITMSDSLIVISDSNLSKIVIYNIKGQFIEEIIIPSLSHIFLRNFVLFGHEDYLHEHVLFRYTLNPEFSAIKDSLAFQEKETSLNRLVYDGRIGVNNNILVFAGYGEPVIKAYDSSSGELLYSRNTIIFYESEGNYYQRMNGEFLQTGYTEEAMYSTIGLEVTENNIYITVDHNGVEGNKFLDVYELDTGNYISSFEMLNYPISSSLEVTDQFIYTIEHNGENYLLNRYRR